MLEPALERLEAELEAATPDVWPRVRRSVAARAARDLLAALDRPPLPHSRLGWELRLRVHRSIRMKEVA